jgi:PAS domain S-box-containing protein
MPRHQGWPGLFWSAFKGSRNPMAVVDANRRVVEVNGAHLQLSGYRRDQLIGQPAARFIVGKPLFTPKEWAAAIAAGDFTGEVKMRCADGAEATVQWGAHPEVVTGKRLILLVALSTSRWGRRFRRDAPQASDAALTEREREVLTLVADGASGPEIAEQLHISHQTVRTHVRNAMEKVGARSRAHLVAKSLGDGHALR